MEQTRAIEDLNKSRDKLEKMKEKAEKKLLSVKSELETTEHEAKENKERARNMLEVVTSEMKTLKKSLEEAEKRERQVLLLAAPLGHTDSVINTLIVMRIYVFCLHRRQGGKQIRGRR